MNLDTVVTPLYSYSTIGPSCVCVERYGPLRQMTEMFFFNGKSFKPLILMTNRGHCGSTSVLLTDGSVSLRSVITGLVLHFRWMNLLCFAFTDVSLEVFEVTTQNSKTSYILMICFCNSPPSCPILCCFCSFETHFWDRKDL